MSPESDHLHQYTTQPFVQGISSSLLCDKTTSGERISQWFIHWAIKKRAEQKWTQRWKAWQAKKSNNKKVKSDPQEIIVASI